MERSSNNGDGRSVTAIVTRNSQAGCSVWFDNQSHLCDIPRAGGPNRDHQRSKPKRTHKRSRRDHSARNGGACADNHEAGADSPTIVVGDRVEFIPTGDGRGRIISVAPRRNRISRRAAGPKPVEQVLAANVDQLVAVFAAAQPRLSWTMLDRYLVIAEAAGVPALICVTKADLADDSLASALSRYERIGYGTVRVCVPRDEGMAKLRERLHGKTSLLVGKSGVGKTTLVRALTARDDLATSAVNDRTGKGRHTTSQAEWHPLSSSGDPACGGIIDTPGVRELGLWNVADEDLAAHFPEMRPLLGRCRFPACTHIHEPDCAVREAATDGVIYAERYESYRRMLDAPPGDFKHEADAERRPHATPDAFTCAHCGWSIDASAAGTRHRNHCPQCLWSIHVDVRPGDRASACREPMEPIAVWSQPDGEWALVHRCTGCNAVRTNRIAGDDNAAALMSLAVRALARPPFPLEMWQRPDAGLSA